MQIRVFSWLYTKLLNILQILLHILIGNVKGFHKMYIKSNFDNKKIAHFLLFKLR